MRFENQVSLYDTDAIINKFNTQDTQFRVLQGNISAIISETEMTELIDSSSTMYSRLASAEMDITGLRTSFNAVNAEVDGLTGDYSALSSRVATYEATVDGLDVTVSRLETDVSTLETWQTEVNLKITDSAIISTVVNSEGFSSAVIQEADSIRLQASEISWESQYSSMTAAGALTCSNITINGGSINMNDGRFAVDQYGNATAMSLTAYGSLICYESYTVI